MNVDECFEKRILRKISPDRDKSNRSIELADKSLKDAKNMMKHGIYDIIVFKAYMTMFHSSRALLYLDGIQEKSHYAIYIYLKEKYTSLIPTNIINLLNIHRIERHESIYGLEYNPKKEDALSALEDAEEFLKEMKKVLKK